MFVLRKCIGNGKFLVEALLWKPGYSWPTGSDPIPRMEMPQTTFVFLSKQHYTESRNGRGFWERASGRKGTRAEAGRQVLSLLLYQELPLWLHTNHGILSFALPTGPVTEGNSKAFCPPERRLYVIQLTFRVAWVVCAIREPWLNWQPDTDNKVDQMKRASGTSLASPTEDYVVCRSCLISVGEGREGKT